MTPVEKGLRSPLTSALLLFLIGYAIALMTAPEYMPAWLVDINVWPVLAVFFVWISLFIYHNLRHPSRKIPFFHYIPVEFREEDEGLQWVTYRACRKTYIFLYSAVPAGLAAITFIRSNPIVPIAVLTLIGMVPFLLYWWELRKWHMSHE